MRKIFLSIVVISSLCFTFPVFAMPDELTGDTKLACETILCLSSGERPHECHPSLKKYFSISAKKFKDTIKKRKNFLKLCPAADDDDVEMKSLIDIQVIQETECSAEALNKITESSAYRYRNKNNRYNDENAIRTIASIPSYCKALNNHNYTDLQLPKYRCNGQYYSQSGWNRGYEKIAVNYWEYRKWVKQGGSGSISRGGRDDGTSYYKHIPVVKTCWFK